MMTKLASTGDPKSELNIRRRLQRLRERTVGGFAYIPESWINADPALQRAVKELDWLKVEQPE